MKKLMKSLMLVAVAAMGLTACQNDINEQVNNDENVTLEIVANASTRSSFGEKGEQGYVSTWTGNEKVQFAANAGNAVTVTNTDEGASARFNVTFTSGTDTKDGVIYAMSPKGDYTINKGGWGSYGSSYIYLTIPTVQTPLANSVDEAAHILFAEHNYEGDFPTTTIGMEFKHAIAYGKMQLILPEGVEASQVSITFPVAVAGTSLKYDYKENTFSNADQKVITLNSTNVENGVYWFGILHTGLLKADMDIEVVATDGNVYKKTIAAADDLEFNQGKVSSFKVNMAACTPEVTNNFVDNAYNLLTSTKDLEIGDKIVIVASNYNKAMGKQNSNNRASVNVVKNENGTVDFDTQVAILTVADGKTAGNFAFKTTGNKYIYAAGGTSSNHLKEESTLSTNSSWVVSIATSGVATIKAENTSTTRNQIRYNNATTNGDLFSCYASGQTDVSIYKLVGEYTPADPAIVISIADYSLAYDATSGSVTMTTEYATGWTFSATADKDWISNITVSSNTITFSSEANEGEDRSATITLVATRDGYNDVTKTFKVNQAAKPSGDITKGESYSYTFTQAQFKANGTQKLGTLSWTLAGNGGYWGWDSNGKGQQFGSGSKPYKTMTLSTSDYEGGVEKIKINTSGASSTNAKVTVTVGGKQIGSTTALSSSAKEYTFESKEKEILSGEIVISYTQTSSKAIYIKSISINN